MKIRNYIISFLLLLSFITVSGQFRNDSILKANNISEIHLTHSPNSNVIPSIKIINENGLIIKEISLDSNSQETQNYSTYVYDSLSRPIGFKKFVQDQIHSQSKTIYKKDSLITEYHKNDSIIISKRFFTRPNHQKIYNSKNVLVSEVKEKKRHNQLTHTITYPQQKRFKTILIINYNDKNQVISKEQIDKNRKEKSIFRTFYIYNSDGLLMESSNSSSTDNFESIERTYYNYKTRTKKK